MAARSCNAGHGRAPWSAPTFGDLRPASWRQGRLSLLGLWGEPSMVHMAILDEAAADVAIVSLDCPDRSYPSVGRHHPPALRLERTVNDLFGLSAQGSPDTRPWLDHDHWGVRFPLGDRIDALPNGCALSFPARGRRRPAPDCGRPGARRYHRARTFPLYRKRRDRGPAGAAARIYPQGHRGADVGRHARAGRATRRTRVGRQYRGLCLCVFEGRRSGA